jgi:hypothetical protein
MRFMMMMVIITSLRPREFRIELFVRPRSVSVVSRDKAGKRRGEERGVKRRV